VQVLLFFIFIGVVILNHLEFEDIKGSAYKSLILIFFYNRVFWMTYFSQILFSFCWLSHWGQCLS